MQHPYARREDAELAFDKLAYLRTANLDRIVFEDISPDEKGNWLNQSNSDFEKLMPLANRQTKLAKRVEDEQAVFGLYSLGVSTNRDDWVYDFDAQSRNKVCSSARYNNEMDNALNEPYDNQSSSGAAICAMSSDGA